MHETIYHTIRKSCTYITAHRASADLSGIYRSRAVGSPLLMDPNRICRKSRKVGNKQREICRDEPEIVDEAIKGATLAIQECQFQFKDRRWNCPTKHRGIRKVLRLGRLILDTKPSFYFYRVTIIIVLYFKLFEVY